MGSGRGPFDGGRPLGRRCVRAGVPESRARARPIPLSAHPRDDVLVSLLHSHEEPDLQPGVRVERTWRASGRGIIAHHPRTHGGLDDHRHDWPAVVGAQGRRRGPGRLLGKLQAVEEHEPEVRLAGQLTSEVRSGYNVDYIYDANGNRISKTVNGVAESYTYDLADTMLTRGRFTSVVEARPGDKWL